MKFQKDNLIPKFLNINGAWTVGLIKVSRPIMGDHWKTLFPEFFSKEHILSLSSKLMPTCISKKHDYKGNQFYDLKT